MKTNTVYKRDVVILDTRTNKNINAGEDFGIQDKGSIMTLKDNKLIVAHQNSIQVISVWANFYSVNKIEFDVSLIENYKKM